MKEITDYSKVFETIVEKTSRYLIDNNIKAQILGISGGIDSTVVAAICYEVFKRTGIPLIGRNLPTQHNKEGENKTARLVGTSFCNEYAERSIESIYNEYLKFLVGLEPLNQTPIANGNIQARLRMIYLYNLASIHKGIVMDTDNLTENNLGYFTTHGDMGDFNPIGGLWKTEVFELAAWLVSDYYKQYTFNNPEKDSKVFAKTQAIMESLKLKPTAGLGITNNDLEEIGAESYEQVDSILQETLRLKEKGANINTVLETLYDTSNINPDIINNVVSKHFKSEFKRKQLPIKITRNEI